MMYKSNGHGHHWKRLTLPNLRCLKYTFFFPIVSGDGGKGPKPSQKLKWNCRALLGKQNAFSGRDLSRLGGAGVQILGLTLPEQPVSQAPCSRASSPVAFVHGTRHLAESPGDVDIGSVSKRSENLAGLCPDDISFGRTL